MVTHDDGDDVRVHDGDARDRDGGDRAHGDGDDRARGGDDHAHVHNGVQQHCCTFLRFFA